MRLAFRPMRASARRAEWGVLALIMLLAAVLRLTHVGRVAPDPFYDAAVRSMGLSWHNFFFGAFEPAGTVSIDKPPIDLWLQVASVKLPESVVALPALAAIACLGLPSPPARRLAQLAGAGAVYVVVALSWLTATLLVPEHQRPYAIGSTNGSAWNAAFVFNGSERLGGKSPEPQTRVYEAGPSYPLATQSERDHIPIVPPSATRLLTRIGPTSVTLPVLALLQY